MTLVAKAAALCAELELSDKLSAADTINSAAQLLGIVPESGEVLSQLADRVVAAVGCEVDPSATTVPAAVKLKAAPSVSAILQSLQDAPPTLPPPSEPPPPTVPPPPPVRPAGATASEQLDLEFECIEVSIAEAILAEALHVSDACLAAEVARREGSELLLRVTREAATAARDAAKVAAKAAEEAKHAAEAECAGQLAELRAQLEAVLAALEAETRRADANERDLGAEIDRAHAAEVACSIAEDKVRDLTDVREGLLIALQAAQLSPAAVSEA